METITGKPGREADYRITLKQIGMPTLMSCGAQMKTLVHDNPNGEVRMKVSSRFLLIVKLMPDDTYAVEVGRTRKVAGLPTYTVIDQRFDVYAEQLAETVRSLGDR
jgi:hypothetical protein